ncbi:MAG: hypothetical protein H0V68_04450 [Actinobacteria bacterium]|nr:hypothetical protein [Actinomycetota bacterium]
MASRTGTSPTRQRVCGECGSTTYPRAESPPGQPMIVTWTVPEVCDGCGAEPQPDAVKVPVHR